MEVAITIKPTAKEDGFVYALGYGFPPMRAATVAKREGSFGEVETGA